MMEQRFKAMRKAMPDKLEEVSRLSFYHWYRLANYSADNYGYINRLDDVVSNYTKADESMPYAPHRVQNLLAYAVSGRGMEIKERMEGR